MTNPTRLLGVLLGSIVLTTPGSRLAAAPEAATARGGSDVRESYGALPLSFIGNSGQVAPEVKFYEMGSNHATFFAKDAVYLKLRTPNAAALQTVTLSLLNSRKDVEVLPLDVQSGTVNYLIGQDRSKWRTHLPVYRTVLYKGAYAGVDIKFYGNNQKLEYDIIVKPGIDPGKIRFAYGGVDAVRVTERGDLDIALNAGRIVQRRPDVYQEIDGRRVEVDGRFVVGARENGRFSYGFQIGPYDKTKTLVIDPILVYSTFLGGSTSSTTSLPFSNAVGIAADSAGNAYVTGVTYAEDFPTTEGAYDRSYNADTIETFVTKLNPAGDAMVYSTFLGGTGADYPKDIVVDSNGQAIVSGLTTSADFPITSGAYPTTGGLSSTFVTKLNADGADIVASTVFGGTSNGLTSVQRGPFLAVDGADDIYLTGSTSSADFPTTAGAHDRSFNGGYFDAYVAKLDSTLTTLMYATFLGGSWQDVGMAIAVDATGHAYVTGQASAGFPTTPGAYHTTGVSQVFIAKMDTNGGLVYSAVFGDLGGGTGIAVDAAGNAYVTGLTLSPAFPTTTGAYQTTLLGGTAVTNGFILKLDATGATLFYSTLLGATMADVRPAGIVIDASGTACVAGHIWGGYDPQDFPITADAYQSTYGGGVRDSFLTVFNATGSGLLYSTYLGGNDSDDVMDIAKDNSGNVYITGYTLSPDFPTTAGVVDRTADAPADGFVAKLHVFSSDSTPPVLTMPAGITRNATSPSGATVTYTVTATDDTTPNPTVVCSPASGTVFSVGATTVNCTASDAAGNTSTASFGVTVKGAAAQLDDLVQLVVSFNLKQGIRNSLDAKLDNAQTALNGGLPSTACNILNAFANQASAQSGKALTAAQAAALIAAVNQIRAVLGCSG